MDNRPVERERERMDVHTVPGEHAEVHEHEIIRERGPESPTRDRIATREGIEARDRSIGSLVKELRDETTTLFRQEMALAKTEMSEKVSKATRNLASIAIGAAALFAGLLFLLVFASAALYVGLVAAGLGNFTAGWLSPLIVGVVAALIGYALVQKGVSTLKRESFVPEKTIDSLKEDKQWLKSHMK